MYRTGEVTFIKGYHTSPFRSQMGIIVDTVIKIGYAIQFSLWFQKNHPYAKIGFMLFFNIFDPFPGIYKGFYPRRDFIVFAIVG